MYHIILEYHEISTWKCGLSMPLCQQPLGLGEHGTAKMFPLYMPPVVFLPALAGTQRLPLHIEFPRVKMEVSYPKTP